MRRERIAGFTLAELMVVIAIIVVLAALLFPMLTGSSKDATMQRCKNTLRQFGMSINTFAGNNGGAFPLRYFGAGSTYINGIKPNHLRWYSATETRFDYRTYLSKALEINDLCQCPFTQRADLAGSTVHYIEASYNLFTGFGFKGYAGLQRRGDRMEYGTKVFDIMAGDLYSYSQADNWLQSSHDTDSGKLQSSLDDGGTSGMLTSRWAGAYNTDPVTLNFVRNDNSVFSVEYPADPSLTVTPYATGGDTDQPNWKLLLPAKQ